MQKQTPDLSRVFVLVVPRGWSLRDRRFASPNWRRSKPLGTKSKNPTRGGVFALVVPRGFEPLVSSVRGRHPRPLDDGTKL